MYWWPRSRTCPLASPRRIAVVSSPSRSVPFRARSRFGPWRIPRGVAIALGLGDGSNPRCLASNWDAPRITPGGGAVDPVGDAKGLGPRRRRRTPCWGGNRRRCRPRAPANAAPGHRSKTSVRDKPPAAVRWTSLQVTGSGRKHRPALKSGIFGLRHLPSGAHTPASRLRGRARARRPRRPDRGPRPAPPDAGRRDARDVSRAKASLPEPPGAGVAFAREGGPCGGATAVGSVPRPRSFSRAKAALRFAGRRDRDLLAPSSNETRGHAPWPSAAD